MTDCAPTYLGKSGGGLAMWLNVTIVALSLIAFLGGLRVMRQGLEGMGKGRLHMALQQFVNTPTRGIFTGTLVTALLQSSAAVTAISVGFVASGTMAFRDAVGVVLGSNVGSTITPQLLTLDLRMIALPCLLVGIILFASHKPHLFYPSMALTGFATIFLALQVMPTGLHPLAQTPVFRSVLQSAGAHPLMAVLAGMLTSAMLQSSTATTVFTMALVSQSAIPLSGGISIVLGANIGTCLTSVIAAVGQSRAAQRVALAHVLLNVGGVALTLPFLTWYSHWMVLLSPNPAQQIANAHTIFNVFCTLLVWPFTSQFSTLVERLLPAEFQA